MSKMMWAGRATAFAFGLTVIVTLFVAPPTSANTIELNVTRSGYYVSGGRVATEAWELIECLIPGLVSVTEPFALLTLTSG